LPRPSFWRRGLSPPGPKRADAPGPSLTLGGGEGNRLLAVDNTDKKICGLFQLMDEINNFSELLAKKIDVIIKKIIELVATKRYFPLFIKNVSKESIKIYGK
jgi:hypothetical protein